MLNRRLADDQLVSRSGDSQDAKGASKGSVSKGARNLKTEDLSNRQRTELVFQRIKDRNRRYKLLNKKVVKESKHFLTLENGSSLRKSGVAEKANRALKKLLLKGKYLKPPTVEDVRRKLNKERLPQSKTTRFKSQPRSKSQNWDDDDDSDSTFEYEPLRLAGKKAAEQQATEAT